MSIHICYDEESPEDFVDCVCSVGRDHPGGECDETGHQ